MNTLSTTWRALSPWANGPTRPLKPTHSMAEKSCDETYVVGRITHPWDNAFRPTFALTSSHEPHNNITIVSPDVDEAFIFGTQFLPRNSTAARNLRLGGIAVAGLATACAMIHTARDLWEARAELNQIAQNMQSAHEKAITAQALETKPVVRSTLEGDTLLRKSVHHRALKRWTATANLLRWEWREKIIDTVKNVVLFGALTGMALLIVSEIPALVHLAAWGLPVAVPGMALLGTILVGHATWCLWRNRNDLQMCNRVAQEHQNWTTAELPAALQASKQRLKKDVIYQIGFLSFGGCLIAALLPGAVGIMALVVGSVAVSFVSYKRGMKLARSSPDMGDQAASANNKKWLALDFYEATQSAERLAVGRPAAWGGLRHLWIGLRRCFAGRSETCGAIQQHVCSALGDVLQFRRERLKRKEALFLLRAQDYQRIGFQGVGKIANLREEYNRLTDLHKLLSENVVHADPCNEIATLVSGLREVGVLKKWGILLLNNRTLRAQFIPESDGTNYAISTADILKLTRDTNANRQACVAAMYSCAREALWASAAPQLAAKAGSLHEMMLMRLRSAAISRQSKQAA